MTSQYVQIMSDPGQTAYSLGVETPSGSLNFSVFALSYDSTMTPDELMTAIRDLLKGVAPTLPESVTTAVLAREDLSLTVVP